MGKAVRVERSSPLRQREVRAYIAALYGGELHAKRVDALAGATLGVMASASLAVALIGQALAQARGLVTKHAVKQVDRLLSNAGIDVWDSFARWVPHQIGARRNILVAMDWTDYDRDGQATLVLSLHARAQARTPHPALRPGRGRSTRVQRPLQHRKNEGMNEHGHRPALQWEP